MKVVAIMGSHRKNGHTRKILKYFLDQIKKENSIRYIDVNVVYIEPCKGCDYCVRHQGECVIKDDDMSDIYKELMASDMIIIASPVYFSAFPSKFKTMIDRTQMIYNLKDHSEINPKKIIVIGVGGAPYYGNQFKGMEYTLEWYLKNFNATEIKIVKISHTDKTPAIENEHARRELDALAEEINNLKEKENG
ncbi:MAG: flavodoxin family protein [Eubacterium sp.]